LSYVQSVSWISFLVSFCEVPGISNMEENLVKSALFQKNFEFEVSQLDSGKFEHLQSHYVQFAQLMLI